MPVEAPLGTAAVIIVDRCLRVTVNQTMLKNEAEFQLRECGLDLPRITLEADVLVRLVELVEALGFCRGHFGHGGPVHKLSHGTLSGQVHFAIIPAE